jgi:hypothetical protein
MRAIFGRVVQSMISKTLISFAANVRRPVKKRFPVQPDVARGNIVQAQESGAVGACLAVIKNSKRQSGLRVESNGLFGPDFRAQGQISDWRRMSLG